MASFLLVVCVLVLTALARDPPCDDATLEVVALHQEYMGKFAEAGGRTAIASQFAEDATWCFEVNSKNIMV